MRGSLSTGESADFFVSVAAAKAVVCGTVLDEEGVGKLTRAAPRSIIIVIKVCVRFMDSILKIGELGKILRNIPLYNKAIRMSMQAEKRRKEQPPGGGLATVRENAPGPGFEPRLVDSESTVLPLDDPGI